MSTIRANQVVGIHYTLKNDAGETLDSSSGREPLYYLQGGENIVPGLERELEGKTVGDKLSVRVAPEDGYGPRDERKPVLREPRSKFPPNMPLFVGMPLGARGPDGKPIPAWIAKVEADTITVDFNHPLAGVHLNFDVEVIALRDATKEELEHGHPHGADGHAHHH